MSPAIKSRSPSHDQALQSEELDLRRGINLFNCAHFYHAHEVLEDVWRPLPRDRPVRRHLQGMVQLAVAFHHHSTGNHVGARSVLERALRNLQGAESSFPHLDLDRLRAELADWQEHLAGRVRRPKPPQIIASKRTP